MKFMFSKTILLTLLVSCCLSKGLAAHRVNDLKGDHLNASRMVNEKTHELQTATVVVHIPATPTSDLGATNSQAKQAERALVVVRRSQHLQQQISPSDMCGGILVSTRIVITAAHCFYDPHGFYRKFPNRFSVTYQREGGFFWDITRNGLRADCLVAHPGYKENGKLNDIGAMRLKMAVCEECLMSIGQSLPMALWRGDNITLEMLVFFIENDDHSNMRSERMPVQWSNKFACEVAYHRWGIHIGPKQICIESLDPKFYHRGESAILLVNDQPIGVLSYKLDVSSTANSLPYIYTDLTRYPDFIQKEIRNDVAHKLQPYRICSSILFVVISLVIVK